MQLGFHAEPRTKCHACSSTRCTLASLFIIITAPTTPPSHPFDSIILFSPPSFTNLSSLFSNGRSRSSTATPASGTPTARAASLWGSWFQGSSEGAIGNSNTSCGYSPPCWWNPPRPCWPYSSWVLDRPCPYHPALYHLQPSAGTRCRCVGASSDWVSLLGGFWPHWPLFSILGSELLQTEGPWPNGLCQAPPSGYCSAYGPEN